MLPAILHYSTIADSELSLLPIYQYKNFSEVEKHTLSIHSSNAVIILKMFWFKPGSGRETLATKSTESATLAFWSIGNVHDLHSLPLAGLLLQTTIQGNPTYRGIPHHRVSFEQTLVLPQATPKG